MCPMPEQSTFTSYSSDSSTLGVTMHHAITVLVVVILCGLMPQLASAFPSDKDSITYRTVRGHLRDFDGDGQTDTLYLTQQRLERDEKVKSYRFIPGYIVWGDSSADSLFDTTRLDLPKEKDVVVGVRIADVTFDGITDIEVLYRWREMSTKKEASIKEKIWLVTGGANLRDETTVILGDAKKSLTATSTTLSERPSSTRDAEQPFGIGGYAIRRVRDAGTEQPKQRLSQDTLIAAQLPSIEVYPNPARDEIHVRLVGDNAPLDATYEVVDIAGRSILRKQVQSLTDIDVRNLATGVYRIRVIGCVVCPVSTQFQIAR